jgi:hypothetical protein
MMIAEEEAFCKANPGRDRDDSNGQIIPCWVCGKQEKSGVIFCYRHDNDWHNNFGRPGYNNIVEFVLNHVDFNGNHPKEVRPPCLADSEWIADISE